MKSRFTVVPVTEGIPYYRYEVWVLDNQQSVKRKVSSDFLFLLWFRIERCKKFYRGICKTDYEKWIDDAHM